MTALKMTSKLAKLRAHYYWRDEDAAVGGFFVESHADTQLYKVLIFV